MIGGYLRRVLERAGLCACVERLERGATASLDDLVLLRSAPLGAVAALADAVRQRGRGGDVRLWVEGSIPSESRPVVLSGATCDGPELLRRVALARLSTPVGGSVALHVEAGLPLAEVALGFGADALVVDATAARALPLADGSPALRAQLENMVRRCGRRALWQGRSGPSVEQRS